MGGGGTGSEPGSRVRVMSEARWIGLFLLLSGFGVALLYEFIPESPSAGAYVALAIMLLGGVALIVVNPKTHEEKDDE